MAVRNGPRDAWKDIISGLYILDRMKYKMELQVVFSERSVLSTTTPLSQCLQNCRTHNFVHHIGSEPVWCV